MKTLKLIIVTTLIVLSLSKKASKKKYTPKAVDLHDHYGAPNVGSGYGPETDYSDYVQRNPEVFTPHKFTGWKNVDKFMDFKPYLGYENKLNPHHIKSGEFTNVAPSANNVINPEITGPKLHVQAEVNYPSHVKVPTFYGFRKEYHPVAAYDRLEGKIVDDHVLLTKPWYGWEDKTENIKREVDQFVNLKTGQLINQNREKKNHGIDTVEEPKKCHGSNKRRLRRI
jgi:hypothetical protein